MTAQNFTGKVVWITGASSGLGEALAREWHARGAKVILSARREAALAQIAGEWQDAKILPLDVAQTLAAPAAVEQAWALFGRIDVMAHNAGVSQRSAAAATPLATTREIMETNFFGPVALTKELLPRMRAGGGRIVVITSLMGKFGAAGRSSYAASKHALHGYFDALRAEEWAQGIRVTLVTPGYVRTAISQNAKDENGGAHGALDRGQAGGMAPEKCAKIIVDGAARDREEILVGGFEKFAVFAKRWAPKLLSIGLRGRNID
ncbi:oxidoreductase [Planctomycetales bacterium]|nr:oxidoreductase [Planctomycetales bacterium]